jgi:DNA-binding NarL/FixJ family response regulator
MPLLYGKRELTSNEWMIAALVAEGLQDRDIERELKMQQEVLELKLSSIYEKTGTLNRTELALWYLTLGIERERHACDRRITRHDVHEERRKDPRRVFP